MKIFLSAILLLFCINLSINAQEIKNFSTNGNQITKFDNLGRAVDAHDGKIAFFNGTYYLYGTSYDCGFEWNNKTAPFCGFKTYSSKDMVNWVDEGFMFDAQTSLWQSRCDGKTYGCFRPHVVYNKKYKNYVLWVNVYDNVIGYRVLTSKKPTGPFTEVAEPKLVSNSDKPMAGLNNGDHDLFIDDDGTGYLALTDWRTKGSIVIEQLTDDYLSGTGKTTAAITNGTTEAPGLFKRKGIYYLTYSDPNCGYCAGTGTSYRTAKSPLGPWSEGIKISDNSCGGQPSFVSAIKVNSETVYLYGSDLWNNAAKNEALANFYWAPLTFAEDGSINPMECLKTFTLSKKKVATTNKNEDNDFKAYCDISRSLERSQTFTASKSGLLKSFGFTTLKSGYPNQDLNIDFYEYDAKNNAKGKLLSKMVISEKSISWAAKNINVNPNINLIKGKQYLVVFRSNSAKGCYGFAYNDLATNSHEIASLSRDEGKSFDAEPNRKLKFQISIK